MVTTNLTFGEWANVLVAQRTGDCEDAGSLSERRKSEEER